MRVADRVPGRRGASGSGERRGNKEGREQGRGDFTDGHALLISTDMRRSTAPNMQLSRRGPFPAIIAASSSLSDLSKNRDFLEYYVLRSPGKIVKLRSDRYYF